MTNDLDEALSRTLREHAGDAGTPRLDLDAVRGRARRIRRTRTALVGAGAAAVVLAVVAPLGLLGGGSSDRSVDPVTRGTASADGSVVRGERVVIDLEALEVGEAPTVAYSRGSELVLPDGATAGMAGFPAVRWEKVVPLGDGYLALQSDGVRDVALLGADGGVQEYVHGADTLLDDPRSDRAALVEEGRVVVVGPTGEQLWAREIPGTGSAATESATPLAFAGDAVVVSVPPSGGQPGRVLKIAQYDPADLLRSSRATGAAYDAAVLTAVDYEGCTEVAQGETVRTSCGVQYGPFAPEGTLVVIGPGDAEETGIVDGVEDAATGERVVTLMTDPGVEQLEITDGTWESSTSLLVSVRQSNTNDGIARYAVVRLDLTTGTAELATEVVPFDESLDILDQGYRLLG